MDFGKAIQLLKEGKRVQRQGWNGKNQYIELATNISYKNAQGEIVNAEHDAIGNRAIAFVGTSGVQLGWLASQADMLAEDWKLVEEEKMKLTDETGYVLISEIIKAHVAEHNEDLEVMQRCEQALQILDMLKEDK